MAFTGASYGGYNAYKQVGVKTASQGKLVVMLYEGAVSHIEKAIALISEDGKIKANSIESFGNHLQKVMDIITELQVSLDMEKGGEIAKNLMSLYIYFNKELLDASISHDKKKLESIKNMLSELHSSWTQAASCQAHTKVSSTGAHSTLNIQG